MIVSFRHKFIFIAIPKTAGHTIRSALRPLLADDDWEQCRLFLKKSFPIPELAKFGHGHLTACQIERHLPNANYDEFFSFAFVRNPYDRFVSYNAFRNQKNGRMQRDPLGTMKASLEDKDQLLNIWMRPQAEFVTNRKTGKLMVSYVARYEDIQTEIDAIRARFGGPPFPLPRVNASMRGHFLDYYDAELREMVAYRYERDFRLFGYDVVNR